MSEGKDSYLTDTQRSGSITGIGIVLGFSLGFISQWSFQRDSLQLFQVLALCFSCLGVGVQLIAFFGILKLPVTSIGAHKYIIYTFALGVVCVLLGFVVHVLLAFLATRV
jgi:hypothetical protein